MAGRGENGGEELQHLPRSIIVADGGEVGAAEEGKLGDGGERALVELDAHGCRAVEARGGAFGQRVERDAGDGGRKRHGFEQETGGLGRAEEGDGAGPGALGSGHVAGGGRLVAAQQGQIEEHDERLADDDADTAALAAGGAGGVGIDVGVEPAGLDVAHAVLPDLCDAQEVRAAVCGEIHHVAGLQCQAAGRQGELRTLARGPGLEQPYLGDLGGLLGIERQGEVGERHAAAAAGETARLFHCCRIVAAGGDVGDLGGGRQIGLLCARQRRERRVRARLDKVVGRDLGSRLGGAAVGEDNAAAALARVEEEGELERLDGLARGHDAVDEEAADEAVEPVRVVGREVVVGEDGANRGAKRRAGDAAGEPVTEAPVGAIAPGGSVGGEGRVGACVPGVDVHAVEIDHAAAVGSGERVGAGDVVCVRRDRGPRGMPAGSGAA